MATDTIIGSTLGNCKIIKKLGEGAQSTVYLAKHQLLDKEVAVKVLSNSVIGDTQQLQRFVQEARASARLEHPNIVQIFDAGSEGDTHYMVMQCVRGPALDRRVKRKGPMKAVDAAELALDIASALEVAHQEKIVHRDIKPGNILLTRDGTPKLVDFGMSRDSRKGFDLTTPGVAVGTPMFMPPEQADGKPADHRSDIFSLGAVLYFLVTGKPPFSGNSLVKVLASVIQDDPPDAPLNKRRVPKELRVIISKMMAKDSKERYQDAGAVKKALKEFIQKKGGRRRKKKDLGATETGGGSSELASKLFWPATILWLVSWFVVGVSGQSVVSARPDPGLLEAMLLPWIEPSGIVWRILQLVIAFLFSFGILWTGADRLGSATRPLALRVLVLLTGVFVYAWAVTTFNPSESDLVGRCIETVRRTAHFPLSAGTLLVAFVLIMSVLFVRAWVLTERRRMIGWILSILALLAGAFAGVTAARPDPGLGSLVMSPGAGPWPFLVCMIIAVGWCYAGLRGFWTARPAAIMVPAGLGTLVIALIFAVAAGSLDFSGAGLDWVQSLWQPWVQFPARARLEGALVILPLFTAVWAVLLKLLPD